MVKQRNERDEAHQVSEVPDIDSLLRSLELRLRARAIQKLAEQIEVEKKIVEFI